MFRLHGTLSEHGQTAANGMLWNCVSENQISHYPEVWLNSPPSGLATNWVVGTILNGVQLSGVPALQNSADIGVDGVVDSLDVPVYPRSLFMAQTRDRIGEQALYGTATDDQFLATEAVYDQLIARFASAPSFADPATISTWAPPVPTYERNIQGQGFITLLDETHTIAEWNWAEEVSTPVISGTSAAKWKEAHLDQFRVLKLTEPPSDWSPYATLDFWMHSAVANGAKIALILASDNVATTDGDYYKKVIDIDWTGWKHFSIPLNNSEFTVTRTPVGWGKIDSVEFFNKGNSAVPVSTTVLHIDKVKLVTASHTMLDENDTIDDWNNAIAATSPVHGGTVSAKWNEAHLDAYRVLKLSQPMTDWSTYGTLDFWMHSATANNAQIALILASDNPATTDGDYYKKIITIDWAGWKHFTIPLDPAQFTVTRTPVGWGKIDTIEFYNKGHGVTPVSTTVLHVDELKLLP